MGKFLCYHCEKDILDKVYIFAGYGKEVEIICPYCGRINHYIKL